MNKTKQISRIAIVTFLSFVVFVCLFANTSKANTGKEIRNLKQQNTTPVVSVLGATLRLADGENEGTQSMRIGIKIDNANKAKDCGIRITVGSKSYVVATKAAGNGVDVQQTKLHSKDIENNSVVYAVVLTNIPKSAFYANISIEGMVWGMDDTLYTSGTVNKNVVGVVDTMAQQFPALNIVLGDDGVIYKNSGASALTADDLNDYSDNPDPNNQENQYATPTPVPTPVPTAVPSADTYAVQVPSGNSIIVDGAVDAAWSNAIEYPFLYFSNERARNSSEATIRLLWDEDYIYGLYDVYDAFIDQGNSDEWNRDGIEIFFDEDNSKESAYGGSSDANTDAFQYRVSGLASDVTSPAKNGFSHNTSATADLYAGLTSNVKTASNGCGYRVEFAIPVVQKNNLGRVVGLDATVMDSQSGTRNNEMWFTSQKSGSMYSDASLFENVKLIATKPVTPVNTPNPADPADCLAHFTFDNSSRDGYVYKSTDGNAKATVIGSIDSVSTEAVSGESLYKAKGNPSYLKLQNADGSSMLDGKNNVTISYWSYVPDAYDSNAINYGWAFYAGRNGISLGTNNRYYLAMIDRDSKYRLDMAKSGGGGNNVDNIAKTSGAWNNVTVVVNGTTSTVYVNGTQKATLSGLTLSEALGTNSKFYIGLRPWAAGEGAEYFQGYIDEFAVFGRAFTSTEVADYVGAVSVPTPAPTPSPTPDPFAWNNNYETQAKYELWTPSGNADTGMLGKEVIFVALADNDKVYAMSANGDAITKTDITDMYFGDTLYIPTNYNLYNISWSTMWNKAEDTNNPDMGKGYLFQNMEDETYLGIWGVEVSSQGLPTGMTSNQIDYKRRFTWSSTLYANYKTGNFLHFDGTDFDADASASNVLCYVKSYTGDNAVKNTWHQVDHFTTGRDYLLVTSNTPGTARALYMNGTANSSYDGKDVTINNDGTITYSGAYNDSAVVNAHSMNDGTFYLNIWAHLADRHTLSYNGNGNDQALYITSDNSLSTYAFRFEYSSGALKVYYGKSGKDTVMPVRWRTRSSGALGVGNGSSNSNEFYIFERDITSQNYTPVPTPSPRPVQTPDPAAKVVIACSDFQNPSGNAAGQAEVQKIINKIKAAGYTTAQGFLCSGDYNYNYSTNSSTAESCVTALRTTIEDNYGTDVDFAMVQGNHDQVAIGTAGMAPSGNNDTDDYGVFVINEDDYMWNNNNETTIKQTAANLKTYLDGKRRAQYTKPIFVISHLALHYSMRTYNDGDDRYAKYIFNELNEAGEAGLNIIFMYGHNHSNGWDDYIGGAAVYLEKGDNILISTGSKTEYTTETLNFTYMNAGYVGYYENHNGGDDALTMSVFEIRDDEIVVSRFDQNGLHNLKASGVTNAYKNEAANGGYSPDTRVIASPTDIVLCKTVITPAETPTPAPTPTADPTGRVYSRITDLSQIQDGDKILMIYNGEKFMVPEKKEVNSRIGFQLNSKGNLSLGDTITGDYAANEWTYTKSSSNWLIGKDGKNIKLTTVSGMGITATLENSGDPFTIGGSANAYTFTSSTGSGVLNYNSSRDLINGYASSPASFYLYRYIETRNYNRVTDVSQIQDGDKVLMICRSGTKFMLPESIEASNSSGSIRIGYKMEDIGSYSLGSTLEGDALEAYEWTFKKSGNKWLIGTNGTYMKISQVADRGYPATLDATGDPMTIGGSANAYTFSNGTYVLNYNNRGVISGYTGSAETFYLYRRAGDSPQSTPTQTPAPNTYVVDFADSNVVTMPSDASLDGNSIVFNSTGSGHDIVFTLPSEEAVKRYTKVTVNYVKESGTFAFKYHKLGAGNDSQNDYRWGSGDEFKLSSSSTSKTVTFESEYYPVDRFVIFDWYASGKITINSIVFTDPLGEAAATATPTPTAIPTATPVPLATLAPEYDVELFTVTVTEGKVETVNGNTTTVDMKFFSGTAAGGYFTGNVLRSNTSCDVVKTNKSTGEISHKARYFLDGTDNNGSNCRLFIEDASVEANGVSAVTKPTFITNSSNLAFLETADIRGYVSTDPSDSTGKTKIITYKWNSSNTNPVPFREVHRPDETHDYSRELFTFNIGVGSSDSVTGTNGSASMIYFSASSNCSNFSGSSSATDADTRLQYNGTVQTLSARYILSGTRSDGVTPMKIYVENNGIDDNGMVTEPTIITDNPEFAFIEDPSTPLHGTVSWGSGLTIHMWTTPTAGQTATPTATPDYDYSGSVDLSATTVNGTAIASASDTSLNGGVISVNETSGDSTELIFTLPNGGTVNTGEKVAVVVSGSCTLPAFNGFRVRLADSEGVGAGDWTTAYQPTTSREFSEVYTLTATSTAYKIALKSRTYNSGPISGLTITGVSVYWTDRGAVAPTSMPSPTPGPTATPTAAPTATPTPAPTATPIPLPTSSPNASILSFSDYQKWKSGYTGDDWDTLQPQLTTLLNSAKSAGVQPDYWLFGGDFTCTHTVSYEIEGMSQVKNIVYGTWDNLNDSNSVIVQGNHDESLPGEDGLYPTGAVEFDDFIIYVLNEDAYPSTQSASDAQTTVTNTANALSAYLNGRIAAHETRPILISSHTGLHYDIDRKDGNNQYAYMIYDVIADAADDLDIIFLFGHNHTNGDELVGGSLTFIGRGDTLSVCHENSTSNHSGTDETINFTYMNYGYVGYVGNIYNNSTNDPLLTNMLAVSNIKIFDDVITVDRISVNGWESAYSNVITRLHNGQ